jgi:hypothetical protein
VKIKVSANNSDMLDLMTPWVWNSHFKRHTVHVRLFDEDVQAVDLLSPHPGPTGATDAIKKKHSRTSLYQWQSVLFLVLAAVGEWSPAWMLGCEWQFGR